MEYDPKKITESIEKYRAGSVEAFNDIYEGCYKLVYTTCYGIVKDEEDARDVTQDVFVKIYEKLDTLDNPAAYGRWMKLIASNMSLDLLRRRGHTYNVEDDSELDIAATDWEEFDLLPDSFIEVEEKRQIIDKVLKKSLSEVQYQTLFMYYFGEMPLASIAESMNCPEGTVKTRLMHAKEKFRKSLTSYLDDNKLVLAAVPFLTRFFEANAPRVSVPPISSLGIPELTGSAGTAGAGPDSGASAANAGNTAAAKTGFFSTVAGKIVVGGVALALVGTAIAVAVNMTKKDKPEGQDATSATTTEAADAGTGTDVSGAVTGTDASDVSVADPTGAEQAIWTRDGNHVFFGHYEQDGDLSNGKEPVEWEILKEEDGKMLLISLHILDNRPYDEDGSDSITWETCGLRRWLNNDFMNAAFTDAEAELVMTTTLSNPNSPRGGQGGNDTEDKVFILSVDEVLAYYDPDDLSEYQGDIYSPWFVREVTPYAVSQGIMHNVITEDDYYNSNMYRFFTEDVVGMDSSGWWLRSPGNFNYNICYASGHGTAGWNLFEAKHARDGVRPVIWLDTADPGLIPVVQNASQGLAFKDFFDDSGKKAPVGCAMVDGIGTCTDSDLVIPSVAPDGKVVAVIEDYAFDECKSIETVVMPDTITYVMAYSFRWCENLRSVRLSNNLRRLGPNAFASCHSLESIVIPEGIETLYSYTFNTCTSLKSVTLPNSLKAIYHHAFNHCTSLESIVIPQNVEKIGPRVFRDCTNLTSIIIPESTLVSKEAFIGSGIKTINGIDAQTWIAQHGVEDSELGSD